MKYKRKNKYMSSSSIPLDIETLPTITKKNNILQKKKIVKCEKKSKTQECVICLDSKNSYDEKALVPYIEELNHELFIKECHCIYNVHPLCIMNWIETNPTCPMCRKEITIPYAETNLDNKDIIILETQNSSPTPISTITTVYTPNIVNSNTSVTTNSHRTNKTIH